MIRQYDDYIKVAKCDKKVKSNLFYEDEDFKGCTAALLFRDSKLSFY